MDSLQDQVQVLLDELVASGRENGVQAAVYRRGELVVDAVAGVADPATGTPVSARTLFYAASAVKGVTATVVHVLAEQGLLDYDLRVADLWPEYGAHGKDRTTIRQVLTHSAGVPAVPMDTKLEQFRDWDAMCEVIAGLEPWWTPGAQTGYHPVTFGFILGEVVRRVTGKPISQVLAEEIGVPLGVADELYFGVPASALDRVATVEDDPVGAAVFASLPADFPLFRSGPRELFPSADLANDRQLMAADVPAWGTVTARGIARMYAALLGEVDGVRLVGPDRLREITTVATTGTDVMTAGPAQYGLGYTVGWTGNTQASPSIFGMVGIGGSAAYADPESGLTIAVTKNRFNPVEMDAFDRVYALVAKEL